ncbi:MAG TPA: HAD-IA family hydrolase, partial [Agitococcus sp.]|nr:HAD-IA family hydrolase [Agitococcus sp.]HNA22766.1 HAD-IA family hydrolase [Agitococcus sp.]HNC04568.1 HAD-IA family hydrolase [Agitococcus sp.]
LEGLLTQFEKKQIPWGIVTNKPRHLSEALLSALNLTERCAVLVCPDDVKNTKPDPEPMYLACKKLAVDCQKTIYIGDHLRDIQAGKNANMTTIAVGFGYIVEGEKIEDWQADYSVETVAELVDLFKLGE